MSKICIIYTGGTIGMVPTDNGYAPMPGYFGRQLQSIRDLGSPHMPAWDFIEFDPLLDSSNMTYRQWNSIAEAIGQRYDQYDGFVILHGTDTMAYSAAALSFMLQDLGKPVVFTGSQIPLCELRSDAMDNLVTSMIIAGQGRAREVSLYFGGQLLRGNRAVKVSADGLIAFASPNFPPLAKAGIDIEYSKETDTGSAAADRAFRVFRVKDSHIGVIKIFPGINFELFRPVFTNDLDALVLETFGTGNIPDYDSALIPLLEEAIRRGTIVCVCTQCSQGTVRLGAYETSSTLAKAGAVSGYNMTTEAAVGKLYYLLSLNLSPAQIRHAMEEDLRGELNNRK